MKKDIILAGVGGQGILSIATVIGYIAVNAGMHLKQSEVHGMSQRGGNVTSHLRVSDNPIASDLIPMGKADMILSVEPMESLRYLPWLSPTGWIITNDKPLINVDNYPDIELIYNEIQKHQKHVLLDADMLAKDVGSVKSANMVMLGAASPFLGFDDQKYYDAIQFIFGKKGDQVVKMNIDAFNAGKNIATEKISI